MVLCIVCVKSGCVVCLCKCVSALVCMCKGQWFVFSVVVLGVVGLSCPNVVGVCCVVGVCLNCPNVVGV